MAVTANMHNKWLKKSVEKILIPAIRDMGYEWKKQGTAREVGREIVLGRPWGSMWRRNDKTMDVIVIALRKRDRSFFRLNAGSSPLDGARCNLTGQHFSAEDIHPGALEESWALVPRISFLGYFGIPFKELRGVTEPDHQKLVRRVVSYLPEIEDALAFGKIGPHMKLIKSPRKYEKRPELYKG